MWNDLNPQQIIGTPAIVKEMDCLTASVSEIEEVRSNVSSVINVEHTRLCGFGGWFDVQFLVSLYRLRCCIMYCCVYAKETFILTRCLFVFVTREEKKTPHSKRSSWPQLQVSSTARTGDNRYVLPNLWPIMIKAWIVSNANFCVMVWIWQVFIMSNPINVEEGDNLNLGLVMSRSKENHRLMEIELDCEIKEASGNPKESFKKTYFIEWLIIQKLSLGLLVLVRLYPMHEPKCNVLLLLTFFRVNEICYNNLL